MIGIQLLWSWVPVLAWAGVIFYFSSIPGLKTDLGIWDLVLRKIAHVMEFGVLTLLLTRAFRRTWDTMNQKQLLLWSGGFAMAYAVSDEIHQSFVPFRGPSIIDVGIDAVGVLGAIYFFYKKHDIS